jgi:hypothetical protein
MNSIWARILVIAGPLLMVLGAVDPLEGSIAIGVGAVLGSLGVRLGGRPDKRILLWGLTVIGVLSLLLLFRAATARQPMLLIPFGLVALSLLMLWWGLRRGAPADRTCVYGSTGLICFGVAAMWVLSAYGGFGEGALSWWWALLVLPFPVGWLRHLFSIGRWIGEGADAATPAA